MRLALRFWDRLLSLVGFRPLNRRHRRRSNSRRRTFARRRTVVRRQRFDTLEKRMVLSGDPPTVYDDYMASTSEDTALNGSVMSYDPEADSLTFSTVSGPSHGSVTWTSPNNYTYTPDADFNGSDSFTYKANDGSSDSNTATVSIGISSVNDAPVASNASNSGSEDGGAVTGTVTASDPEGDSLTFSLGSNASSGNATVDSWGNYSYTPNANFHGSDSFTFSVSDGNGGSDTKTVNISISSVPDAPVAADGSADTYEDTPLSSYPLPTATDGDGDTVTYSKVSNPYNGSVTVSGSTFTYTPNANYYGSDSFQFSVSDGTYSNTYTMSINVASVNDAPTANNASNSGTEDNNITGYVSGSDIDGSVSYAVYSNAAHGSVTIDSSTGAYTYTPEANYNGSDSFVFSVFDGDILTQLYAYGTVSLTISAVNDAPVVAVNTGLSVNEGSETTISSSQLAATDPDNTASEITYTISTGPAHGTLMKGGFSVTTFTQADIDSNALTYLHDGSETTSDGFTFSLSDGVGGSVSGTTFGVTITLVNDPPTTSDQSLSTDEDTPLTVTPSGSDAEGDTLSYSVYSGPSHGTAEASGSNFLYTPTADYSGSDSFTIRVSDGHGGTADATISVTVNAVNDAPVVAVNTGISVNEGSSTTITTSQLSATDVDNTDSQITYTITTGPAYGTLKKSGTATTSFTQADIAANLLSYTHDGSETTGDSFTFSLSDGAGGSLSGTSCTVTITPINDAPTVSTNTGLTLNEAATASITSSKLSVTDPDNTAAEVTFTVTTFPTHGGLYRQATLLSSTDATFTQQDVNNGYVTYQHDGGETTSDSFSFTVADGSGGSIGTTNFAITVTPVSDAPVMTASSLTVMAGDTGWLGSSQLMASDPDNDADELTYTLASTPAYGKLYLDGVELGSGGHFTQADVNDGLLTYDNNGSAHLSDSFGFSLNDGSGGTLGSATCAITVRFPPVVETNEGLDVAYGFTETIDESMLKVTEFSDVAETLTYTLIGLPSYGTLRLGGYTLYYSNTFTQQDIAGGLLSYERSGALVDDEDSFTFTVSDGKGGELSSTSFTIRGIPDAQNDELDVRFHGELEFTADELLANDSDWDGDEVTIQPFESITTEHDGTVTYDAGTEKYTYTKGSSSFSGDDTFSYTVVDDDGNESTATVTIHVAEPVDPTVSIESAWLDGRVLHVIFVAHDDDATDDSAPLTLSFDIGSATELENDDPDSHDLRKEWTYTVDSMYFSVNATATDEDDLTGSLNTNYDLSVLTYNPTIVNGAGTYSDILLPGHIFSGSLTAVAGYATTNFFSVQDNFVSIPGVKEAEVTTVNGRYVNYSWIGPGEFMGDEFSADLRFLSTFVTAFNVTVIGGGSGGVGADGLSDANPGQNDPEKECDCPCSCHDKEPQVQQSTGAVSTKYDVASTARLAYSSTGTSDTVIHAPIQIPAWYPDTFGVELTFDGAATPQTYYFDKSSFVGDTADLGIVVSTAGKASGLYDWSMKFFNPTDPSGYEVLEGKQAVVNTTQNGLSAGWSIAGVDRLVTTDTDHILLVRPSGAWSRYDYDSESEAYEALDGIGTLTTVSGGYRLTDEDGSYADFDGAGFLTDRVDINGNVTSYAYDSNHILTGITDPLGRTTTFGNDGIRITSITDPDGRVTTFDYDATTHELTSYTQPDPDGSGGADAPSTSFTYLDGRMATQTDAGGSVLSYEFDDTGRIKTLTNPDGKATGYVAADLDGVIAAGAGILTNPAILKAHKAFREGQTTDAEGRVTQYTVDRLGLQSSTTDALGVTTLYERNESGRITKRTEVDQGPTGEDLVTNYTYSGDNLTRVDYPDGHYEKWDFVSGTDLVSQYRLYASTSATQPLTRTLYEYDSAGNKTKQTQVIGEIDEEVNVDEDPNNNECNDHLTIFEYLPAANGLPEGMLASMTEKAENEVDDVVTTYAYYDSTNSEGHSAWVGLTMSVTTGTAALSSTSIYGYDDFGRLTRETQVVGLDDDDEEVTENDDQITLYEYDNLDRQTKVTRVAGEGIDAELNADLDEENDEHDDAVTLYRYDALGRVVSQTSVVGAADDPDVLNDETTDIVDDQLTLTTYDAAGHVTQTVQVVGHIDSLVNADEDEENDEHDDVATSSVYTDGDLTSTTDALGRTTTYEYDERHQLIRRTDPDPDGAGDLAAPVTEYRYDAVGRLTDVIQVLGAADEVRDDGEYVENTERPSDDPDDLVQHTEYDAAGRVVSTTDSLGRSTTYVYDVMGRQTRVTEQLGHVSEYVYDTLGNLIDHIEKVIVDEEATVVTSRTHYVYDMLGRQIQTIAVQGDLDLESSETDDVVSTTEYDRLGRVSAQIDPLGRRTEYRYDGLGNTLYVVTVIDTVDEDFSDPTDDLVTHYTYDNAGRLLKITEPDPDGDGTTTPDDSPVTDYQYDRLGRQILTRQVVGSADSLSSPTDDIVTRTTFDNLGRILSVTDPRGAVTTYAYDTLGRQTSVTLPDPDGAGDELAPEMSQTYDKLGRVVSSTDPRGFVTTYEYDDLDRLVKTSLPHDPEAMSFGWASQTVYDDAGRVAAVVDALGRVTKYAYDAGGRVTSVTFIDGDEDGPSGPVGADPVDTSIAYEYDDLDRILETNDPIQGSIQRVYDDAARTVTEKVAEIVEATLVWTVVRTTVYDELGRVATVTVPGTAVSAGSTTTYTYAADGQCLSQVVTDEEDEVLLRTDYVYDLDTGRRTHVIQVVGERDDVVNTDTDEENDESDDLDTETVYDNLGRVVTQLDPLGHGTYYAYDSVSRVTSQLDAESGQTDFHYDQAGNRTDLVDPDGNNTHWEYDTLNRVTTETQQDAYEGDDLASRTFRYDAAGSLIRRVDRENRVIDYVYDEQGRRTREYWFAAGDAPTDPVALGGSTSAAAETFTYAYDDLGRLLSVFDRAGNAVSGAAVSGYEYDYDRFDRLTSTTAHSADQADVVLTQTYDDHSRRATVSAEIDATADFTRSYEYDALGQLAKLSQAQETGATGQNAVSALWATFGYNGLGQIASLSRGTSTDPVVTTAYQYDPVARLASLTHKLGAGESSSGASGDTLAGYTYAYDAAGRITSFVNTQHAAETATNSYDDTNQLTGSDRTGTSTDETYDYDENGNRDSSGYVTDAHNRTTEDPNFVYTYDDEGNRTSKTAKSSDPADDHTTLYIWDQRNRLAAVVLKNNAGDVTQRIEYRYDAFDHLIGRYADVTANGSDEFDMDDADVERYVYDGNQIAIVQHSIIGSGVDTIERYLWGAQVDQILAQETINTTTNAITAADFQLTDHQNTVRDLVTTAGSLVSHFAYNSFGQLISATDASNVAIADPKAITRFFYTARQFDFATALQENWHRWYDNILGKWLTEDPIGFNGQDQNTYRYIGASPLDGTDPSGLIRRKGDNAAAIAQYQQNFNRSLDNALSTIRDPTQKRTIAKLLNDMFQQDGLIGAITYEAIVTKGVTIQHVDDGFPFTPPFPLPIQLDLDRKIFGAARSRTASITYKPDPRFKMPALGNEIPDTGNANKIRNAQITVVSHELSHSFLSLTDYLDPAFISDRNAKLISPGYPEVRIPDGFSGTTKDGLNLALENLVHLQLGMELRASYILCPLESQSTFSEAELARANAFLDTYGLGTLKVTKALRAINAEEDEEINVIQLVPGPNPIHPTKKLNTDRLYPYTGPVFIK